MTNENDKRNVALIAGMAAGFGETLARELSRAGYAVAGLSRTAAKVSDLAQEIGHSGSLYRDYACNLGNADQVARTFKEVGSRTAHRASSSTTPCSLLRSRSRNSRRKTSSNHGVRPASAPWSRRRRLSPVCFRAAAER